MDGDYTELEKLIHSFEFENKQCVRLIEKKNQEIISLSSQIEVQRQERLKLEEEISRFDEDTKRMHRTYTNNQENIGCLKNTLSVIDDHMEALCKQLQVLQIKTKEECKSYDEQLSKYTSRRDDYMAKYKKFPLAVELEEIQKQVAVLKIEDEQLAKSKDSIAEEICNLEAELDTKVLTRIIVRMIETQHCNKLLESEIHECVTEKSALLEQLKELQKLKQNDQPFSVDVKDGQGDVLMQHKPDSISDLEAISESSSYIKTPSQGFTATPDTVSSVLHNDNSVPQTVQRDEGIEGNHSVKENSPHLTRICQPSVPQDTMAISHSTPSDSESRIRQQAISQDSVSNDSSCVIKEVFPTENMKNFNDTKQTQAFNGGRQDQGNKHFPLTSPANNKTEPASSVGSVPSMLHIHHREQPNSVSGKPRLISRVPRVPSVPPIPRALRMPTLTVPRPLKIPQACFVSSVSVATLNTPPKLTSSVIKEPNPPRPKSPTSGLNSLANLSLRSCSTLLPSMPTLSKIPKCQISCGQVVAVPEQQEFIKKAPLSMPQTLLGEQYFKPLNDVVQASSSVDESKGTLASNLTPTSVIKEARKSPCKTKLFTSTPIDKGDGLETDGNEPLFKLDHTFGSQTSLTSSIGSSQPKAVSPEGSQNPSHPSVHDEEMDTSQSIFTLNSKPDVQTRAIDVDQSNAPIIKSTPGIQAGARNKEQSDFSFIKSNPGNKNVEQSSFSFNHNLFAQINQSEDGAGSSAADNITECESGLPFLNFGNQTPGDSQDKESCVNGGPSFFNFGNFSSGKGPDDENDNDSPVPKGWLSFGTANEAEETTSFSFLNFGASKDDDEEVDGPSFFKRLF